MIGLGKLGKDCAEVMSQVYDVAGYDVVKVSSSFINVFDNLKECVESRDIIFISVPTPHATEYGGETPVSDLSKKDFDYSIVKQVLDELDLYLNKNQLVVLISTVLPGTVRNILNPTTRNFRFIYNPYLIAMGTVKWDMVNPEMIIIGTEFGNKTNDAQELIDFYKPLMENNPRFEIGTWDEAESIKIFYNTFISTKLALVNMIQDVAELNGNINVDVVTAALSNSTHRITSSAYMKAGMGDGGACHPRDNIALSYLANRLNLGYDLFNAVTFAREKQAENMAKKCLTYGKNVCILGKAYKPSVPYQNGSYSLLVGFYIEKHGGIVSYYDPNTNDLEIDYANTDVYLIGYWEDWLLDILKEIKSNSTLIDPWRNVLLTQTSATIVHYGNTTYKN